MSMIPTLSGVLVGFLSLVLGSSAVVAVSAALIVGCSASLIRRARRVSSLLALLFIGQNFATAILIRIASLKDLDGNLSHPQIAYVCAAVLSVMLWTFDSMLKDKDKGLIKEPTNVRSAEIISIVTLAWGLFALFFPLFATGSLGSSDGSDTAGIGIFNKHIAFMCTPAAIYMMSEAYRKSAIITWSFVVVVVLGLVLALVLNQRKTGFDIVLAAAMGYWAGRGQISFKTLVASAIAGAAFFGGLSPIISYMRFDVNEMPLAERPAFIVEHIPGYVQNLLEGRPLPEGVRGALAARYLDYAGSGAVIQRIAGVQIVDFALATSDKAGFTSDDPVVFGIRQALPSFLSTEKKRYSQGDLFTWRANLRPFGREGHPFVNVLAAATWGYGPAGGVLLSFILVGAAIVLTRSFAPKIDQSLWSVVLFIAIYNPVGEADVARYIELVTRIIPEFGLAAIAMTTLAHKKKALKFRLKRERFFAREQQGT